MDEAIRLWQEPGRQEHFLLYFKHIVISIWEWVSMYFVPISHQTRTLQHLSNLGSDKLYLLLLIIILYISNSRCIRVARNVLYSSYFFWAMLKSASRHLLIIYFLKKLWKREKKINIFFIKVVLKFFLKWIVNQYFKIIFFSFFFYFS